MKLKQLLAEKRAVSPVIGVILMVAITVILAAVIGTFVLGLGESVQSTPQAKFAVNYQNGELSVTHEGGDAIPAEELSIVSSVQYDYYNTSSNAWDGTATDNSTKLSLKEMGFNNEVSAGMTARLMPDTDASFSASTVRVVWSDLNTGKSATLERWSGPDA